MERVLQRRTDTGGLVTGQRRISKHSRRELLARCQWHEAKAAGSLVWTGFARLRRWTHKRFLDFRLGTEPTWRMRPHGEVQTSPQDSEENEGGDQASDARGAPAAKEKGIIVVQGGAELKLYKYWDRKESCTLKRKTTRS